MSFVLLGYGIFSTSIKNAFQLPSSCFQDCVYVPLYKHFQGLGLIFFKCETSGQHMECYHNAVVGSQIFAFLT